MAYGPWFVNPSPIRIIRKGFLEEMPFKVGLNEQVEFGIWNMCITEKRLRGMKVQGRRLWSESRREKIHVGGEPCRHNRKLWRHDPEVGQDEIREELNAGHI